MITPDQLAQSYFVNLRILQRQTEGLSHEDSLRQLPFRGNCLNWILGHIAVSRDRVLVALEEEPLLTEEERLRYETGSEPITPNSKDALRLERLLELLAQAQEIISRELSQASREQLAGEIQIDDHKTTVGDRVFGLYFHETYHTGQAEALRQLAGKDDKVI